MVSMIETGISDEDDAREFDRHIYRSIDIVVALIAQEAPHLSSGFKTMLRDCLKSYDEKLAA